MPTVEQRSGDFSKTINSAGAVVAIYDPATTRQLNGATVRDQFTNNQIPVSRLDAVGLNLLKLYPLPNKTPDNLTGANNYRTNYVQGLKRDAVLVKVDHVSVPRTNSARDICTTATISTTRP